MHPTIKVYALLSVLSGMQLSYIGVTYSLFIIDHGYGVLTLGIVNACCFFTQLCAEIPTGIYADVYGRRYSFIVSNILTGMSMFVYYLSTSLPMFIMAEMCFAIGNTFATGAFDAWIKDMMVHQGIKTEMVAVKAYVSKQSSLMRIIGCMLGAWAGTYSLSVPWLMGAITSIATAISAIILMEEPYFRKRKARMNTCRTMALMRATYRRGIMYAQSDAFFRALTLTGAIYACALSGANMQWSVFFQKESLTMLELGVFSSSFKACILLGGALVLFLTHALGETKALTAGLISTGLLLAASSMSDRTACVMIFFLMHEVGRGIVQPLMDALINSDRIPQSERATVLSLQSMAMHIGGTLGLVLTGGIGEFISIQASWLFGGVLLVAFPPLLLCKFRYR